MKAIVKLPVLVMLFLMSYLLPLSAADNATACASITGWRGKMGIGGTLGYSVEKTFEHSFRRGDVITIGLYGFEAGVAIEIPSDNIVASYPYGFTYLSTTFRYIVRTDGIKSVKIKLHGHDVTFNVSCRSPQLPPWRIIVTDPQTPINGGVPPNNPIRNVPFFR